MLSHERINSRELKIAFYSFRPSCTNIRSPTCIKGGENQLLGMNILKMRAVFVPGQLAPWISGPSISIGLINLRRRIKWLLKCLHYCSIIFSLSYTSWIPFFFLVNVPPSIDSAGMFQLRYPINQSSQKFWRASETIMKHIPVHGKKF